MTEVTVIVRHVWPGHLGGAVFQGADSMGNTHRIVASNSVLHRAPSLGESWRIQGSTRVHPKFGLQIYADLAVPVLPKGEHLRRFLARNRAFQGVGEVRAKKLWDSFGEGLVSLLDNKDRSPLVEVLGDEITDGLLVAWEEFGAEVRVVQWLETNEFPLRLATKVVRLWGVEAPEKIDANPYRMLAVAGWLQVDGAALKLGVAPDAEIRRIAAVEAMCYRSMADKHTVIEEMELLRGVSKLLNQPLATARESLALAEADHAVIRLGDGRWQAFGPHVMESYVKERIEQMVATEHVPSGHLLWKVPTDTEVDDLIEVFEASNSLKLTDEQKHAVWLALTQRFGLISGGAGTGKTTMLKAVQFAVEKREGTTHAIALAGRAAIRMHEATGYPARTIAGFLGAHERGDLILGGGDLVIVDEASMVDLPLMYSLLRAIPEDARMLMVGDPYQLPPIGMGVVFTVYCEDDRAPKVQLTQVHRQAAETGIPITAGQIRAGVMPALEAYAGQKKGISFLPCAEADAQAQVIELLGELGGPGDTQILGAVKRGPSGILAINHALYHLCSVGKETWEGFAPDDPVIWLHNDYERRIWNGTLGVVKSAGPTSLLVHWDGHEKPMPMEKADLQDMDLAYAISIHKAQGSQFQRVIVPIFKSRLLERTLIYTALTRATEQVVLIGDAAALRQAVEAPPAPHRRNHGLALAKTASET